MKDPVKAEDGFTYDRQHLEQVRNTFNVSPFPLQYPILLSSSSSICLHHNQLQELIIDSCAVATAPFDVLSNVSDDWRDYAEQVRNEAAQNSPRRVQVTKSCTTQVGTVRPPGCQILSCPLGSRLCSRPSWVTVTHRSSCEPYLEYTGL